MSGACSQPLQCPATAMRQLDPVTNPRHMCEGYSSRFVMCVCVCVCVCARVCAGPAELVRMVRPKQDHFFSAWLGNGHLCILFIEW